MNCPYKWTNSIDEEDDQTRVSLKERMLKNSLSWRRMMKKESGAGQRRAESPDGEGELTHDWQFTISLDQTNREVQEWKRVQGTKAGEQQ